MSITNIYAKNFQNGRTYYGWKALASAYYDMGCGYYSSSNFVFAIKFDITDRPISSLQFKIGMSSSNFTASNVSWNYKFFTSESELDSYSNANQYTYGDGTVTWNKGSNTTSTVNFSEQLDTGTHYLAFWRTGSLGCEIRWSTSKCSLSGTDLLYKITFTGDVGFASAYPQGYLDSGVPLSITTKTKTGYLHDYFTGTQLNGSSGGYWTDGQGTSEQTSVWYLESHDRDIYVHTKPIEYTVIYNGNGSSSGSTASSSHIYNQSKNLTKNGFKRTGYVFSGWAETRTGSKKYSDNESVINLSTLNNAAVTLYAVWQREKYTVSYDSNGHNVRSGMPASQTKTYGIALKLSDNVPVISNSTSEYKINLDVQGGQCSSTSVNTTGTTQYSFKHWSTASDDSGTKYSPGSNYSINQPVVLYLIASESLSYSSVALPTASKAGYIFKGWATNKYATSGSTGTYQPDSTQTLYAIWEAETAVDPITTYKLLCYTLYLGSQKCSLYLGSEKQKLAYDVEKYVNIADQAVVDKVVLS